MSGVGSASVLSSTEQHMCEINVYINGINISMYQKVMYTVYLIQCFDLSC